MVVLPPVSLRSRYFKTHVSTKYCFPFFSGHVTLKMNFNQTMQTVCNKYRQTQTINRTMTVIIEEKLRRVFYLFHVQD